MSEKQLLDTLVERGALNEEEAALVVKSCANIPTINSERQSRVKISAKMQTQYAYIDAQNDNQHAPNSTELNGFMVRRMILTFDADNKDDWGARLSFDFVLSNKVSITYMWHKIDTDFAKGEFRFGYIKPDFCYEENMSPFKLYCVERSIATYYWGGPRNSRRLGFGSFMSGAYWFGESRTIKGLNYAFAATNSENYQLGYDSISNGKNNSPNIWLSSSYGVNIADTTKVKLGLNLGFGADANKEVPDNGAAILGANPYITLDYKGLRTAAEFLISQVDGGKKSAGNYENAMPMGLNFLVEYKIDIGEAGKIAPVFRFTWLDTDGRGVTPSDGLRKCVNISNDMPYKSANGFYFGLNWYIIGDTLKIQTGYEFARFQGALPASDIYSRSLDSNSARAQIQVLF